MEVEYRIVRRAFTPAGEPVRLNDGSRVIAVIGEVSRSGPGAQPGVRLFDLLTERTVDDE